MRYALATVLAALLVCVGCEQKKAPQTGGAAPPTATAGGELRPLEPPTGSAGADDELAAASAATPVPAGPAPGAGTPVPVTHVTPITSVSDAAGTPVAAAPAAPTGGGTTHVVQPGETMWKIAMRHYGNGQRYRDIIAANPGIDPAKMQIGQRLVLPAK
jgi:nucleoid-associated protein YgaU